MSYTYVLGEPVATVSFIGFLLFVASIAFLIAAIVTSVVREGSYKKRAAIFAVIAGILMTLSFMTPLKEPSFTKETCTLSESSGLFSQKVKIGKHSYENQYFSVYTNLKTNESFFVKIHTGHIIHKNIICYRVPK